ncbi:unnamed protein product [Nyctereutes procyonoides]|uniref:(raccoon dog) hypothetical protein n=1 Tax=Nyctereutes procyonoides TaxID=34880 RepID=A0A811ZLM4_NYCPR|nr:unnamed protein product [Nyctereutes procyonoides]
MPENAAPLEGTPTAATGGHSKTAYGDRDKPAQIRFSNIPQPKLRWHHISGHDCWLLDSCTKLLQKGIHPTIISESFQKALEKEILTDMSRPVELSDSETLLNSATTSLNSKVVSQYSSLLSPMSVNAVMKVIDPATATSVDLRDIKIVKKLGGTIDDCELVEGLVLTQKVANSGITSVEKAKIGLIQFCLSAPKMDMDNQIVVSDYVQMDQVLREERAYILNLVKQIKKQDVMCSHIDQFTADMLGSAELAEEVNLNGSGKLLKITGCTSPGKNRIVVGGSNKLVIKEAERSIHDALCVIHCLVKKRALIAGGGAPGIELALRLTEYSRTLSGMESYCIRAFADAMEGGISNILEELVVQPLLVSVSALTLATETIWSILKIDDVVNTR